MPADGTAAGARGRGRFLASDADREQAVDVLKAAFVQGRLGKDEFGLRVGRALTSRTCADLDAVTADIPSGPARARPRPPAPAREPGSRKLVMRTGAAVAVAGVVTAVVVPMVRFPGVAGVITGAVHGCVVAALLAVLLTFLSRVLDLRSGRRGSQGPPAGTRRGTAARGASPGSSRAAVVPRLRQ